MAVSDDLVTMADIARLAEVTLPAVSNWRRRHETFPRSERRNGQELFVTAEVAHWLDSREVAKGDLKASELSGITYGDRFRRNKFRVVTGSQARFKESLWKELSRFRGAEDIAAYADLVLGLLYLSVQKRDKWVDIAAAGVWESGQLVEIAILETLEHRPLLLRLHRALSSFRGESRGVERLGEVIRVLDQVQRMADSEMDRSLWGGEVFEYLLNRFAAVEGKRGLVVTPPSVIRLLVELIALKPGESVLDPCSGSGGFLVEAAKYIEEHGGRASDVVFFGQAILERSWAFTRMNLDLHRVRADLAARPGIALHDDLHSGRRFDAILVNPPFNMSDWRSGQPTDRCCRYGSPPKSNANFAWLQHIWSSLAEGGRAAVVMANNALSSEHAGEGRIRAAMVEDGVVEALIALPPQLFSTTAIPVTVWLLRRPGNMRDDEVLFVDARMLGSMISRTQRDLLPDDNRRIVDTVLKWRDRQQQRYQNIHGFSASAAIQAIREHEYQLTPGRYVGTEIRTGMSANSVIELRYELDRLHLRAMEVDAIADQQLSRITAWNP
ncbi:MAG: N-6 DNA methylase [Pseudonocardiaceae bacterium]